MSEYQLTFITLLGDLFPLIIARMNKFATSLRQSCTSLTWESFSFKMIFPHNRSSASNVSWSLISYVPFLFSILFYSLSFCSILSHFILILFYSILFSSILLWNKPKFNWTLAKINSRCLDLMMLGPPKCQLKLCLSSLQHLTKKLQQTQPIILSEYYLSSYLCAYGLPIQPQFKQTENNLFCCSPVLQLHVCITWLCQFMLFDNSWQFKDKWTSPKL